MIPQSYRIWILWLLALFLIILLSFQLLYDIPDVSKLPNPFIEEISNPLTKIPNSCCIATIFDSNSFLKTLSLGYSLHNLGSYPPRSIAFLTSDLSSQKFNLISKYFEIINISNSIKSLKFQELIYWNLTDCYPLITVSNSGIFNKSPNNLCNIKPFSAVSQRGDIVFFDTHLMIINPQEKIEEAENEYSFSKFINNKFINWNSLSTDLSVEDYDNDFLDFWMKFSSPTYIHFNDDTFKRAYEGKSFGSGSRAIFQLLKRNIGEINEFFNFSNLNLIN